MPNDPMLRNAAAYPFWTEERIRFGDTDRLGHVNNAVYGTYLETARVELMQRLLRGPETYFVLARMSIDYLAEMQELGPIRIGTAITGIGRSSFTTGQGIFQGEMCSATGDGVVVLVDAATRRSTPLPADVRAALEELSLKK